jgi:hypothetical protein
MKELRIVDPLSSISPSLDRESLHLLALPIPKNHQVNVGVVPRKSTTF